MDNNLKMRMVNLENINKMTMNELIDTDSLLCGDLTYMELYKACYVGETIDITMRYIREFVKPNLYKLHPIVILDVMYAMLEFYFKHALVDPTKFAEGIVHAKRLSLSPLYNIENIDIQTLTAKVVTSPTEEERLVVKMSNAFASKALVNLIENPPTTEAEAQDLVQEYHKATEMWGHILYLSGNTYFNNNSNVDKYRSCLWKISASLREKEQDV